MKLFLVFSAGLIVGGGIVAVVQNAILGQVAMGALLVLAIAAGSVLMSKYL